MKISIIELLGLSDQMIEESKLHLAIGYKEKFEPLYAFYREDFKFWQERQNNKNFEKPYIISMIYYGKDEWLFAGVYKRLDVKKPDHEDYKYLYNTELMDISFELIGRLIIKFRKNFRQSYPHAKNYFYKLELLEILREKYTVEPFSGYANVRVMFELLKSIIDQEERSWKIALSNVKGVYVITDISNGKQYIGSAYNEDAFWTRWQKYSINGHGGNVLLRKLISEKGLDYAKNFQFSILETRSMTAQDDEIIKRESFWKDVMMTREFGYNKN